MEKIDLVEVDLAITCIKTCLAPMVSGSVTLLQVVTYNKAKNEGILSTRD